MKKLTLLIAVFSLTIAGSAQKENETQPDTLQQKANYNTTRTSKTIAPDKGKGKKKIEKEEKKEETKVSKPGGNQSIHFPSPIISEKRAIRTKIK